MEEDMMLFVKINIEEKRVITVFKKLSPASQEQNVKNEESHSFVKLTLQCTCQGF